jgi:hypothetical protein
MKMVKSSEADTILSAAFEKGAGSSPDDEEEELLDVAPSPAPLRKAWYLSQAAWYINSLVSKVAFACEKAPVRQM